MKTSESPVFGGGFQLPSMRWQVQKLVFPTPADMIDQKNKLKQVTQRHKHSKTAVEFEKIGDNFWGKYPSRTMSTIYESNKTQNLCFEDQLCNSMPATVEVS